MITHEEAKYSLYFLEITADLVVFDKNQKIVEAYITQQEQFAKDVKRYIFLDHKNSNELTDAESDEWLSLWNKLTKGVEK